MERLLTIDDVAELLQMTPRFVERQIRLDYIEALIVGTEVRIEPEAVQKYVENRKTVSAFVGQQHLKLADEP
ncbi:MAG: DNA-binding protein [Gemmatimonadetes bacterium]|nr:MAG: DNA-binding protein [Gemmatimonadota bacterium]